MPMLTHSDRSGKHHAFDMQRDAHVRVLSTLCHLVNAADVLWLRLRTPHHRLLNTPVQVAKAPSSWRAGRSAREQCESAAGPATAPSTCADLV
jgi:hypothetical protein